MEGRPRRGRRRRQSSDQGPAQPQGALSATEGTPGAPSEEGPPVLQEAMPASFVSPSLDEQVPASPAAAPAAEEPQAPLKPPEPETRPTAWTPAEETLQPQMADQTPSVLPQTPVTSPPPPQPPPPGQRGEQRQSAGHPKGQQREHGRGDQGRGGDRGDQGRGDQRGDQGRRPQDGIVAAWSIPIRADNEIRRIEDVLRGIRKALEEECMVGQDDASERVLLDLVMNAIRDRITVHRIQPITRDLEETERLLRLRNQTDRHVVEMLTALKSA